MKERHDQMRKPYQSPGWTENSSYYIVPVGDWTHDLPHTVASNMVKVSDALNHLATEAVSLYTGLNETTKPRMRSQEWDGRLQIIYKNYCVVNIERIWPTVLYKDARAELGDVTVVMYATSGSRRTSPAEKQLF